MIIQRIRLQIWPAGRIIATKSFLSLCVLRIVTPLYKDLSVVVFFFHLKTSVFKFPHYKIKKSDGSSLNIIYKGFCSITEPININIIPGFLLYCFTKEKRIKDINECLSLSYTKLQHSYTSYLGP